MIANAISFLLVMVFIYFVAKKKVLPALALKRAAKTGQAVQTMAAGQAAENLSSSPASLMQTGLFSGQSLQSKFPVMCFDMRLINLHEIGSCDGDTFERRITYEANEMLLKYCSRGITPTLHALMINDDCLMLYVTYAAQ